MVLICLRIAKVSSSPQVKLDSNDGPITTNNRSSQFNLISAVNAQSFEIRLVIKFELIRILILVILKKLINEKL